MGLVALSSALAGVTVSVRVKLGAPVLFHQERVGRDEKPFRLHKVRSMTDGRGPDGQLPPDVERLPAFGRWLRSTSLDELSELWNVLVGEMTFVGSRPLPVRYLHRYRPLERRRRFIRASPAGLRSTVAMPWTGERLAMDIWYVDSASLWLEARILVPTASTVIQRDGVRAEVEATMGTGERAGLM